MAAFALSSVLTPLPFLHFPPRPEYWCRDGWSSERLESGTGGLSWALMKQSVPDLR